MSWIRIARVSVTGLTIAALTAAPVAAEDCNVNVFDAYQTAVKRGWRFNCSAPGNQSASFVTYPMNAIGCVARTPVVQIGLMEARGRLFDRNLGTAKNALLNGWTVLSFEVSGAQWTKRELSEVHARVHFAASIPKNNWTYNVRVDKLTLRKDGGSCAKAIDEAF